MSKKNPDQSQVVLYQTKDGNVTVKVLKSVISILETTIAERKNYAIKFYNLDVIIEKTRAVCFNSTQWVEDHFVEITEMIKPGQMELL